MTTTVLEEFSYRCNQLAHCSRLSLENDTNSERLVNIVVQLQLVVLCCRWRHCLILRVATQKNCHLLLVKFWRLYRRFVWNIMLYIFAICISCDHFSIELKIYFWLNCIYLRIVHQWPALIFCVNLYSILCIILQNKCDIFNADIGNVCPLPIEISAFMQAFLLIVHFVTYFYACTWFTYSSCFKCSIY